MLRSAAKTFTSVFRIPIDLVFFFLALPASVLLLTYRKLGSRHLPMTTGLLKTIGMFPIRDHYYEPLFKTTFLKKPLHEDRKLPGLDLNELAQIALLQELNCSDELIQLDLTSRPKTVADFCLDNDSFRSGDAEYLYQFLRRFKPRKVIEIGSGYSTKIAKIALDKNVSETHLLSQQICIEPYEMPWLESLGVKVIRQKVEDIDFDWGSELAAGDLLFIDSSHMIRPQGDVLVEYLEIIPQLKSGVYVHVHDIFTPKDYLQDWLVKDVRFWNEQYLLEALLTDTRKYQIVGALNFLKHHHFKDLKAVCPYLTPDREPGSFYFVVK